MAYQCDTFWIFFPLPTASTKTYSPISFWSVGLVSISTSGHCKFSLLYFSIVFNCCGFGFMFELIVLQISFLPHCLSFRISLYFASFISFIYFLEPASSWLQSLPCTTNSPGGLPHLSPSCTVSQSLKTPAPGRFTAVPSPFLMSIKLYSKGCSVMWEFP